MSVFTNYHPDHIFHPAPVNLATGDTLVGSGPPPSSLGGNNTYYFDETNNLLYFKDGDVWNLVSGSTTIEGGTGTSGGSVDPEGVFSAPQYTIYTNSSSTPKTVWVKTSSGTGTTGWTQIV